MDGSEAIAMILGSLQDNVQRVQSDVNQKGEIFAIENDIPTVDLDGNLKSSKLKQVSTGVAVEGDILIQSGGKLAVGSSSNYGTTGQVLTSNSTTDSPSWETMTFTKLADTPASLGTTGQVAQVNSAGDALEFVNVPTHVNNAIATKQNQITVSSRLNANLVGDGSVDNTELSHLSGITSNVQTQIDSKERTLAANQKIPWDIDQNDNYKIHTNNLPFATSNSVGGIKLGDGLTLDPLDSSKAIVSTGNGIIISSGSVEIENDFTSQPSGVHPFIRLEYIPLQSGGGLSKTNNELHLTDEINVDKITCNEIGNVLAGNTNITNITTYNINPNNINKINNVNFYTGLIGVLVDNLDTDNPGGSICLYTLAKAHNNLIVTAIIENNNPNIAIISLDSNNKQIIITPETDITYSYKIKLMNII